MKKVIIIGAGPAGLTAAYELLKQSTEYEVVILEESADLGGISKTVEYHGNRMDMGGHRFFSKSKKVNEWWMSMLPLQGAPSYDDKMLDRDVTLSEMGPDPEKEDRVMLNRTRVSRIYYKGKFFDYPVTLKWQTFKNMGFITTIKAGFSYLISLFYKRKENSLEDFYINRFGKVLYSMFFESYTEKLWGRHPSKISPDWGKQRVKGLSVGAIIKDMAKKLLPAKKSGNANVETSLIEEFYYPKYGPGQLWNVVALEIEDVGGKILLQHKVKNLILGKSNHVTEVVYEEGGKEYRKAADIVISSMPIKDLIAGMDHVAPRISDLANKLPYRDYITAGLLVSRLNLKNRTKLKTLGNIVPDCWIYVQDAGVNMGRIQIFNNWSPYMVKDPENTVWIGLEYFCMEGDPLWNLRDEEFINMAILELIKIGVIDNRKAVLDSNREKVKKAYPAYFDSYSSIHEIVDYLNQVDNLYCVGRNGQHRYNNLDHSMMTAFETVSNIINGIHNRDNIWNVNIEQAYHEA